MARGEGKTTQQMKNAPYGAHYIWTGNDLHYPKMLAAKLGRKDLHIHARDFLSGGRKLRGLTRTQVVIDHDAILDQDTLDFIQSMHD